VSRCLILSVTNFAEIRGRGRCVWWHADYIRDLRRSGEIVGRTCFKVPSHLPEDLKEDNEIRVRTFELWIISWVSDTLSCESQRGLQLTVVTNYKIGKVYSLEYTDIPKLFFMSLHVGHCCTSVIQCYCYSLSHSCTSVVWGHCCCLGYSFNVTRSHCCSLSHFSTDVIRSDCWSTMCSHNDLSSHCCTTIIPGHAICLTPYKKRDNQTDMDGHIKCSSLTLERQEHLITD
jgi:hypothetical protein